MAQYTQRAQPILRSGQASEHVASLSTAYGGKSVPAEGVSVSAGGAGSGGGAGAGASYGRLQTFTRPHVPLPSRYLPQPRVAPPPRTIATHPPPHTQSTISYRDGPYGRMGGVEYLRVDRQRISLLPTGSTVAGEAYGARYQPPVPSPSASTPPQQPPPVKKMRLAEHHSLPHHSNLQPLRVDTRETLNPVYPQVEPISPTLPADLMAEDQTFRTTKDELLQQIAKVDRDIALNEQALQKLKKKQSELEEVASKPAVKQEVESEVVPKHQCLVQKIYLENRKKALNAHAVLDFLGQPVRWPIYNQPLDTEVYHENKRNYQIFKRPLLEYFKKKHLEREARESYLVQHYTNLMHEWVKKVEKIESTLKRKTKDAKNREFFEKVFPELRKQREDKERFNRVGARIKSEADLEEIMDGLQEQELEDKKMRSYAVIPPIMLDSRERKLVYTNTNGICTDMKTDYKDRSNLNTWTEPEKEIFKEKYLQHPKNFGLIASFLDRKNVQDCVRYYYLSKKTENYKQLLRKSRQRTRSSRNNPQKVNQTGLIGILSTGVTTRLQREQQQKTGGKDNKENRHSISASVDDTKNARDPLAISQKDIAMAAAKEKELNSSRDGKDLNSLDSDDTKAFITPVTICISQNSDSVLSETLTIPSADSPNSILNFGIGPLSQSMNSHASESSPDPRTSPVVVGINPGHAIMNPSVSMMASVASNTTNIAIGSVSSSISNNGMQCSVIPTTYMGQLKMAPGEASVNNSISNAENSDEPSELLGNSSPTYPAPSLSTLPNVNVENSIGQDVDKENKSDSITTTLSETKKKISRRKENSSNNETMETSDDDIPEKEGEKPIENSISTTGHPCIVCREECCLQTRPVARKLASHYGLREDTLPPGARVCKPCHCKCVRYRYTKCPVPTCPMPKIRAKRLRHLPPKWLELPADIKDPVVAEFQIPPTLTKCCLTCFKRITRKLSPHLQLEPDVGEDATNRFTEEEVSKMKVLLQEHGTNWKATAESMAKPLSQVKRFYNNYRELYNLDKIISEYNKMKFGDEMKPVLTDEEESGSSTSSCDENFEFQNSDTASAESPSNSVIPQLKNEVDITVEPITVDPIETNTTFTPVLLTSPVSDEKSNAMSIVSLSTVDNLTNSNIVSQANIASQPSSKLVTKDEYDSSATETADEENESPTNRQSPKVISISQTQSPYPSQATITVVPGNVNQHNGPVQNFQNPISSRSENQNHSPLTVGEVMVDLIERSFKKTNIPSQSSTLQKLNASIIPSKSDSTNDITFVREYKQEPTVNKSNSNVPLLSHRQGSDSLATLSVVNSHSHSQQAMHQQQLVHSSQIAATITPVNQPPSQSQEMPKESLVVVQIQQADQDLTLDLSVKKPREQSFARIPQSIHPKPLIPLHPSAPGQNQPIVTVYPSFVNYQHNADQLSKSPSVYVSTVAMPPRGQSIQTPISQVKVSKAVPRLSPKIGTHGPKGSITHGTPVNSQPSHIQQNSSSVSPRYDILRQTPPETKIGSITQGTPVHLPPHHLPEKRIYDYYATKRQSPSQNVSQGSSFSPYSQPTNTQSGSPCTTSVGTTSGGNGIFTSPSTYSRPSNYGLEQRQIIMADYITSQQMHGAHQRRTSQEQPPPRQPTYITSRDSPADHINSAASHQQQSQQPQQQQQQQQQQQSQQLQQQAQQQRREGVIQRHNTIVPPAVKPPSPHHLRPLHHYPPPGHEALTSLVDVAVQQPSLPVPHTVHKEPSTSEKPNNLLHQDPMRSFHRQYQMRQQAAFDNQQRRVLQHQVYQDRERDRQIQLDRERERQIQLDRERERERDWQLQIQEHDKQVQLDRDRERVRERQIALERERQIQHMHQQIQERDRQLQQQQIQDRVQNNEEERARRERETRMLISSYSSHQPPPARIHERVENRPVANARPPASADETLTAASLIDAIITHEINRNCTDGRESRAPPKPALNNRYITYNSDHRDIQNSDQLPSQPQQQPQSSQQSIQQPQPSSQPAQLRHSISPAVINVDLDSGASSIQTKNITLGELTDSIITKDYNPAPGVFPGSKFSAYSEMNNTPNSGNTNSATDEAWKRRNTTEDRHIIRQGPPKQPEVPSPTSQHHHINRISQDGRISAPRRYVASSPTAGAPPPSSAPQHLSAFDYVTSRIVEVMRTEDESKRPGSLISATGDNNPSGTPPPPLAYPFSALNVSGLSTGAGGANATDSPTEVSRPPTLPSQEPKPLMSSQYEPLSDED